MGICLITGSSGLIGSEAARFFHQKGLDIVGIDNNMREYFFGRDGSTEWNKRGLKNELTRFEHYDIDIRDRDGIEKIYQKYNSDIVTTIHCAAQPSHDWAAKEPFTDFEINATGTLNLLESARKYSENASFIFTSTNKVYGDTPNNLPLIENESRFELASSHLYAEFGIDEQMTLDQSKHSLFGASKVAADIMVQEYGRYFDMKTACFRGGCLTGPAHSGAKLHGFLAYLAKCVVTETPYTIFGYNGKQVRDNIHAYDLVNAFWHFYSDPKAGGKVYNMGGGRHSNCSMLEAISNLEELTGKKLNYTLSNDHREGDHIWWISDVRKFKADYPGWNYRYDLNSILREIVDALTEREVR